MKLTAAMSGKLHMNKGFTPIDKIDLIMLI
jgi:hypothetical protein